VLSLMNGLETLAGTEAASYDTGLCRSRCPAFLRSAQRSAARLPRRRTGLQPGRR